MSKPKRQETEARWYEVRREPLTDYNPAEIDAETFVDVMPRLEGSLKEYAIGKEPPPEGHVDDSPHGRSIRERRQVLKPVEVDELGRILDGFDRWGIALRHHIVCPLVRVLGLREDQKRDYILEVNAARRNLDARFREGLAIRYLAREEVAYKAGEIKHRSVYNKVAVLCGIGPRKARQIERGNYPERWQAACAGETRVSQNGKTFEIRESDPEGQIKGLQSKLAEDTPVDQQEAAIRALREIIEKYGDLIDAKDRKELKEQVADADQRLRRRKASEEKSRSSSNSSNPVQPLAGEGEREVETEDEAKQSVAEILEAVDSDSEIEDLDRRPFTVAISLYLEQRLLPRHGLTVDQEWQDRVARVAGRCGVSGGDVLRLLRRRPSSLEPTMQVLDRLFLAGGVDPSVLRDALSKHVLEAFFQAA